VPWPASPTCPLSSGGDPGESGLRLDGVSPFTFAGQAACVSGCFPDYALGYGLKLDGATELSPWGLSPTSAMIGIPNTTSPGQHTITSADGSSTVTLGVLTIEGSIDQNKLWTGQSTTMRLRVLGTDVATPFDVLNRTPGIIDIEGGVRQQVTTPGGPDNAVTRGVKGIHRGDFSILYSVNVRDYCGVAQGQ